MNRDQLVVSALAAGAENASFTPVQVQKLFFLIDREISHLVGGPHFAFEPYDYGPFDKGVYDTLDKLSSSGFAAIQVTGKYRVYSLTPEGYHHGRELFGSLAPEVQTFLQQVSEWVRKLNFQQLVSAIYEYYPDMKVNSVFS